jgi:hypothetical protein
MHAYRYTDLQHMSSNERFDENKNIDLDDMIKKEARGINDADFGEVQFT